MKYAQLGFLGAVSAGKVENALQYARELVLDLPFQYSDNGLFAELDEILVKQYDELNKGEGSNQKLSNEEGGYYHIKEDRFEKSKEFQAKEALDAFREEDEDEEWQYSKMEYKDLKSYNRGTLALMMAIEQEIEQNNPIPLTAGSKSSFIRALSTLPNFKTGSSFKNTQGRFQN